jgi:hypothetical protein
MLPLLPTDAAASHAAPGLSLYSEGESISPSSRMLDPLSGVVCCLGLALFQTALTGSILPWWSGSQHRQGRYQTVTTP